MKTYEKTIEIGKQTLILQIGKVAQQASAAVLARYGDSVVLTTVVFGRKPTELDYFPLQVEYIEKLYAGGRIKGSRWIKREGRPSDEAILSARLTDRSIRPLFPKSFKKDVQVVTTILSVDKENEPDILSMIATSTALAISSIPWQGPIGAVRIGLIEDNFIINPARSEMEYSDLDLIVAGTKDKVMMLEAGADQVSEEKFYEAVEKAQTEVKKIVAFIEAIVKDVGKIKEITNENENEEIYKFVNQNYKKKIQDLLKNDFDFRTIENQLFVFSSEIAKSLEQKYKEKMILETLKSFLFEFIREKTIAYGKRFDGRGIEEIRPLSGEVSLLPRTHGSAIFQRGDTQVLTVTTLASPSLEQWLESAEGEETKRYIHHYFMPPYSVGETGRVGFISRREVGHGALAERALIPVIPSQDKFPYTIRVVSEVLSSNGSTSMASACGSTLSLMDAGVPIKEPVAGISIGLVTARGSKMYEKYVLLTDISGVEDFSGDMDFKVAGTKNGITAVQLDVKIPGLTMEIIEKTLTAAKKGRLFILETMLKVLPNSRQNLSKFAPKVEVIKLPSDKVGEVIGPGGKMIRQIISETDCDLNVDDDGVLTISGVDKEKVEKAVSWVKNIIREIKVEEVFEGEVQRIATFGAFVEITPGKEGLVHVSQMKRGFVKNPEDVVKVGQKVKVRVIEVDDRGRIRLSMLFGSDATEDRKPQMNIRRPRQRFAHEHLKDYR